MNQANYCSKAGRDIQGLPITMLAPLGSQQKLSSDRGMQSTYTYACACLYMYTAKHVWLGTGGNRAEWKWGMHLQIDLERQIPMHKIDPPPRNLTTARLSYSRPQTVSPPSPNTKLQVDLFVFWLRLFFLVGSNIGRGGEEGTATQQNCS